MLKKSGYVGIDEGPYWDIAKNPMEAARLLLKKTGETDD